MLWTGCRETLGSDDGDGTNLCFAHLCEEESSLGQGMSNNAIQCLCGRFKFARELLNSSKFLSDLQLLRLRLPNGRWQDMVGCF